MKKSLCCFAAIALSFGVAPSMLSAKSIDYKASVDIRKAKPGKKVKCPRGFVFEDLNRDGKFQRGEPGIAGVMVSNGREVVVTDSRGRYRLPKVTKEDRKDGMTIFITEPKGYDVPVDKDNVPQFYYHHLPKGSPKNVDGKKFRFGGLEPTGPLPKRINFPLVKSEYKEKFKVVISGDTQPYSNNEVGYVRDTLANEISMMDDIEALIVEGDVIGDDLSLYPRFKEVIGSAGVLQYLVPGNHDLDFDAPTDANSFDTFKREWGPAYYSFDIGKVHFMVLDDVSYPCTPEQNHDGLHGFCEDPFNKPTYNGIITEKQMEWIKNDLAHVPVDSLIVLNMHIPPQVFIDMDASKHQVDNIVELYDLLGYGKSGNPKRPALAFSGHSHTLENIRPGENYSAWDTALGDRSPGAAPFPQIVAGAASGSWWSSDFDDNGIPMSYQRLGAPRGYLIIEFDGNTFKDTFKASGKGVDKQMSLGIVSPTFIDWAEELIAWMRTPADSRSEVVPVNVNDLPDTKIITREELVETYLSANIWNGSRDSIVHMQIDGRKPVKMTRTQDGAGEEMMEVFDPFALRMQLYSYRFAAKSESGKERNQGFELWTGAHFGPENPRPLDEWLLADQSMHLWAAPIPANLATGVHVAKVTTTDKNGTTWEENITFEIRDERPQPHYNFEWFEN